MDCLIYNVRKQMFDIKHNFETNVKAKVIVKWFMKFSKILRIFETTVHVLGCITNFWDTICMWDRSRLLEHFIKYIGLKS